MKCRHGHGLELLIAFCSDFIVVVNSNQLHLPSLSREAPNGFGIGSKQWVVICVANDVTYSIISFSISKTSDAHYGIGDLFIRLTSLGIAFIITPSAMVKCSRLEPTSQPSGRQQCCDCWFQLLNCVNLVQWARTVEMRERQASRVFMLISCFVAWVYSTSINSFFRSSSEWNQISWWLLTKKKAVETSERERRRRIEAESPLEIFDVV